MHKDIELWLYDENWNCLKVLMDFTSLQWVERYYQLGTFELYFSQRYIEQSKLENQEFYNILINTKYLYRKDKDNMGIVNGKIFDDDSKSIILKGNFLEIILNDIVIEKTFTYSGKAEDVARQIVNDFCINPSNPERKIDRFQLGEYKGGLGTQIDIQRTGKSIYYTVSEILSEQKLSFKINYDNSNETMFFEVYKGTDRTQDQTENTVCIFSKNWYNVLSDKYEIYDQEKNFAYVAGAGTGTNRKIVEINNSGNGKRKEIYIDARDIQQEDGMTETEYENLLINRGYIKLSENKIAENVECKIDVTNMQGINYGLGDKCTYINPTLNKEVDAQITEIWESIENNNYITEIVLGYGIVGIAQKINQIDVSSGSDGATGQTGQAATIKIGTTTTGAAGTQANVTNSGDSTNAEFNFTIPRGNDGITPNVQAGTTTTGAAGTQASVTRRINSTDANPIFDFIVPQGQKGSDGSPDTPEQILNKIKTVDGLNSGLDADLLDGKNSTDFVLTTDFNNYQNSGAGNNFLINGNFDIWQRGISFNQNEIFNLGGYTCDRWKISSNAQFYNISKQDVNVNDIKNVARISLLTKGNLFSDFSFLQGLQSKNVYFLRGKQVTFSIKIRRSFSFDIGAIRLAIYTGTGIDEVTAITGRIATTKIINFNEISTTELNTFFITTNVPVNTSSLCCIVRFSSLDNPPDNCYIEISHAKLEIGDTATPFIPRLNNIELNLSQEYFYIPFYGNIDYSIPIGNISSNGKVFEIPLQFPFEMRTIPKFVTNILSEQIKGRFVGDYNGNIIFVKSIPFETIISAYNGYKDKTTLILNCPSSLLTPEECNYRITFDTLGINNVNYYGLDSEM